jgi:hypothetical protein
VDDAYASLDEKVGKNFIWPLVIARPPDIAKGFDVLLRRLVMERNFGWLGCYDRCLVISNTSLFQRKILSTLQAFAIC